MGYAQTRTVPLHWIWLGVILTLLESWNADWTWVAPNILLSLALIRIARPYVQILVQRHGWAAFALLVCRTFRGAADSGEDCRLRRGGMAVGPVRLMPAPYMSTADRLPTWTAQLKARQHPRGATTENAGLMRLLACFVAAVVYVWQEQREFSFPQIHFAVFILGVGVLSLGLCLFRARPEPHPTARSHSRRPALHRPAHSGNLRHPACRLRTHCKVGARSRPYSVARGGAAAKYRVSIPAFREVNAALRIWRRTARFDVPFGMRLSRAAPLRFTEP